MVPSSLPLPDQLSEYILDFVSIRVYIAQWFYKPRQGSPGPPACSVPGELVEWGYGYAYNDPTSKSLGVLASDVILSMAAPVHWGSADHLTNIFHDMLHLDEVADQWLQISYTDSEHFSMCKHHRELYYSYTGVCTAIGQTIRIDDSIDMICRNVLRCREKSIEGGYIDDNSY